MCNRLQGSKRGESTLNTRSNAWSGLCSTQHSWRLGTCSQEICDDDCLLIHDSDTDFLIGSRIGSQATPNNSALVYDNVMSLGILWKFLCARCVLFFLLFLSPLCFFGALFPRCFAVLQSVLRLVFPSSIVLQIKITKGRLHVAQRSDVGGKPQAISHFSRMWFVLAGCSEDLRTEGEMKA